MSYIQSTIRCNGCGIHMNVAFGIVGMTQIAGWPDKCPKCGSPDFQRVAPGWHADDNGNLRLGLTRREDRMPDIQTPEELALQIDNLYLPPIKYSSTFRRDIVEGLITAREAAIRREERPNGWIFAGYGEESPINGGPHVIIEFRTMEQAKAFHEAIRAREPVPSEEPHHE